MRYVFADCELDTKSDTPGKAGGLMSRAASKAVILLRESLPTRIDTDSYTTQK